MSGAQEGAGLTSRVGVRDRLFVLALLGFLLLTVQPWGWDRAIAELSASDVFSYEPIARAAPGFPDAGIPALHAQRWPIHWATGVLADMPGLSVHAAYRLVLGAGVVALVVVADRIWTRLGLSADSYRLCMAALLLNPYALRFYLIVPGYLADVWLVVGLSLVLLSLIARQIPLLLAGVVLSAVTRQSSVLTAVAVGAWILLDPSWRVFAVRVRLVLATGVLVLTIGLVELMTITSSGFDTPFSPQFPEDTMLDVIGKWPAGAGDVADHLLRTAAPLILLSGLLVGALAWAARDPSAGLRRIPVQAWLAAGVAASIVLVPLAESPEYATDSEPRLSALAVLPLCLMLAVMLRWADRERGSSTRIRITWIATGMLVVTSLHHLYASVGPMSVGQFSALQVLGGLVLGVLAFRLCSVSSGAVPPRAVKWRAGGEAG